MGHRTRTAEKAKIICPPQWGGGHKYINQELVSGLNGVARVGVRSDNLHHTKQNIFLSFSYYTYVFTLCKIYSVS